jgi:hypothetical protein
MSEGMNCNAVVRSLALVFLTAHRHLANIGDANMQSLKQFKRRHSIKSMSFLDSSSK